MPLWREAHFEVKMGKTPHARTTFGRSDVVSRGSRKGFCTVSKVRTSEMLGGQGADFLRGLHLGASDLQVC